MKHLFTAKELGTGIEVSGQLIQCQGRAFLIPVDFISISEKIVQSPPDLMGLHNIPRKLEVEFVISMSIQSIEVNPETIIPTEL